MVAFFSFLFLLAMIGGFIIAAVWIVSFIARAFYNGL